jgi:hypothetical protein
MPHDARRCRSRHACGKALWGSAPAGLGGGPPAWCGAWGPRRWRSLLALPTMTRRSPRGPWRVPSAMRPPSWRGDAIMSPLWTRRNTRPRPLAMSNGTLPLCRCWAHAWVPAFGDGIAWGALASLRSERTGHSQRSSVPRHARVTSTGSPPTQLMRNELARFYHHRTRKRLPPKKLRRTIQ